jgi:hypothetical protein
LATAALVAEKDTDLRRDRGPRELSWQSGTQAHQLALNGTSGWARASAGAEDIGRMLLSAATRHIAGGIDPPTLGLGEGTCGGVRLSLVREVRCTSCGACLSVTQRRLWSG